MTAWQAGRLIAEAGTLVPRGIYAVRLGQYMELRNDPMAGDALEAEVEEWERRGFDVWCNR